MTAQPVRLMKYVRRYGLLHKDGTVQVGSGGPFLSAKEAGPLETTTWEVFEDWLNDAPLKIARNPGQRGRMKHLKASS